MTDSDGLIIARYHWLLWCICERQRDGTCHYYQFLLLIAQIKLRSRYDFLNKLKTVIETGMHPLKLASLPD